MPSLFCATRVTARRFIMFLALLATLCDTTQAQVSQDRWSLGILGGANVLRNDFNTRKFGPNLEFSARYGLSRSFAVGASFGYEELKAFQDPINPNLTFDYVSLDGFPLSLMAWYYPLPGKTLSPFVYAGVGVMVYRRWDGIQFVPEGFNSSIHLPMGVGLEVFATRNMSIIVDASYRFLDDNTETLNLGGPDGYLGMKVGLNFYVGKNDAGDDDSDGLSNGEERTHGTDPLTRDSDEDGLYDGDEVKRYGSDPLRRDSDGDLLTDEEEVYDHKTDPLLADSDGDSLTDGEEKTLGTNPLAVDTDADGLADGEEKELGTNPVATDSDGDRLPDKEEVKLVLTSPVKKDTDGDDLSDGDEVLKFRTNPLLADTDEGGVNDGAEVARGSDPGIFEDDAFAPKLTLDAQKPLLLEGVLFEPGSARISRGSETALENVFIALVLNTETQVDIVGHTDNSGSVAANNQLSLQRAEAVKLWLMDRGIPAERLRAIGMGPREPVAPNDNAEGRKRNRRIELRVRQQ